jgi:hypothetical protein
MLQTKEKKNDAHNYIISKQDKMFTARIQERIDHLEHRSTIDWYDRNQLSKDILTLKNVLETLLEQRKVQQHEVEQQYFQIHRLLENM